jgi:2-oxoglutarate dehydrogenase E2 component (dihydrolipoamide succinyltransferase)
MNIEIKIPQLGESVSEAIVSRIMKPNGSYVKMDEEILELETDKVNQVLYAPKGGEIQLQVKEEDTVEVGQIIGFIEEGKEPPQEEGASPAKEETPPKESPKEKDSVPEASKSLRVKSSEGIKNMLSEKTSPAPSNAAAASTSQPQGEREQRVKMTRLRSTIAKRLVEAKQTTAMLTTFNEVDMKPVMEARSRLKDKFQEKHDVKLGFMSFFVKACVLGLLEIPEINAYIDGDEIVYRNYYDVGIAVGTDRGLMVPVVRNCESLGFSQIESQIVDYATKARKGGLKVDDLQGAGFTITNGGVYGSLLSTPIINPPQSAILGMHTIQQRPVAINNEVVIRPMMYIALSYDHRIIDGKEAVTFLVRVKEALEDPVRMLLDV